MPRSEKPEKSDYKENGGFTNSYTSEVDKQDNPIDIHSVPRVSNATGKPSYDTLSNEHPRPKERTENGFLARANLSPSLAEHISIRKSSQAKRPKLAHFPYQPPTFTPINNYQAFENVASKRQKQAAATSNVCPDSVPTNYLNMFVARLFSNNSQKFRDDLLLQVDRKCYDHYAVINNNLSKIRDLLWERIRHNEIECTGQILQLKTQLDRVAGQLSTRDSSWNQQQNQLKSEIYELKETIRGYQEVEAQLDGTQKELENTRAQLEELKTRLGNVLTIEDFEAFLAEKDKTDEAMRDKIAEIEQKVETEKLGEQKANAGRPKRKRSNV